MAMKKADREKLEYMEGLFKIMRAHGVVEWSEGANAVRLAPPEFQIPQSRSEDIDAATKAAVAAIIDPLSDPDTFGAAGVVSFRQHGEKSS